MPENDFEPWDRFSEWIHSICVVTFDLEIGQALEIIYPGDALLSTQEKTNICYLAFPDSNSGEKKDTNFHFRIRRQSCLLTEAQEALYLTLPPSSGVDPCYLYGFVHFRQQKDSTIPRGYFQKSLVLLSVLPFINLYATIVEQIALRYFEVGEPAIEAACHDIDCWSAPEAGVAYSLPLLGSTIQCRIPSMGDFPYETRTVQQKNNFTESIVLPSINQVDIYKALNTTLNNVQLLWELVLLGEPLLVMTSNPSRCSLVVQALVSLIAPLKYSNDFRPFFTIHDSEFKEYSHRERSPPKVLLGVTNPFFVKAMDHWPHILKVGDLPEGTAVGDKQEKTRKNWDGKTLDTKTGLYTQYKPYLNRDKAINKKLMKSDRPDEAQCSILRRHFLELTQSFMIPLERYLSSLMPLRKEMSPFKAMPTTRPFVLDEFLSTIGDSGPGLTCGVKGDWAGLYQRFITSSNFAGWFSHRTRDVNRQLKAHFVDALCSADLGATVLSGKHQVEVVDLVLRFRKHITDDELPTDKQKLMTKQMVGILSNVDDELKQVLLSNCALREFLA